MLRSHTTKARFYSSNRGHGLTITPRFRAALVQRVHRGVAVRLTCPNDPTGVAGLAPQRAGVWAASRVVAVVWARVADGGVRVNFKNTRSGELAKAVRAGCVGSIKCDHNATFRHTGRSCPACLAPGQTRFVCVLVFGNASCG